jgi:hypothetical protein
MAFSLISCVHGPGPGDEGLRLEARRDPQSTLPPEVQGLTPEERLGRAIWYNATAGNSHYHAYAFGQRVMGRKIKWGKILRSDERDFRFNLWGLINDPGCCKVDPRSKNSGDREACCRNLASDPFAVTGDLEACRDATPEKTFGFDFCAGDSELLPYVGRTRSGKDAAHPQGIAYNDPRENQEGKSPYKLDRKEPACELGRFSPGQSTERDREERAQDSCDLDFGTSTGVLGYRKFPNPRFDASRWRSWQAAEARPDDHSVEPPFLIGIACGACHIGFSPGLPPLDPNHPTWDNIRGLVGNQFVRNAVVLGSGVQPSPNDKSPSTLEWEEFAHERPGATDTSAIPNDQISNPGTMNAIIATQLRPHGFREKVFTWYQEDCGEDAGTPKCWEDPQWRSHHRGPKFWHWRDNRNKFDANYTVYHILKGGEDSIGAAGAVQRVYINIGSCAEQCWLNHLTDLRVFLPSQRNFGETPLDTGQCRRDCPAYRAIEDRVPAIFAWLKSAQPIPLVEHKAGRMEVVAHEATTEGQRELERHVSEVVTPARVEAGRQLFVQECRRCHSSMPSDTTFKNNFMSSDRLIPISVVKTDGCRARHSNHLEGEIWSEFASEKRKAMGTGYYKVPSLLNAWAYAPFGHANEIGPEVCSRAEQSPHPEEKWYVSPLPPGAPACTQYPVTVLERFELFEKSLQELLTDPGSRTPKVTLTDREIDYPLIGELAIGGKHRISGAVLRLPAGLSVSLTGSFRHKEWANDLFLYARDPGEFARQAEARFGAQAAADLAKRFEALKGAILGKLEDTEPPAPGDLDRDHRRVLRTDLESTRAFFKYYSGCTDEVENAGHPFASYIGKDPERLRDLTAFLATL